MLESTFDPEVVVWSGLLAEMGQRLVTDALQDILPKHYAHVSEEAIKEDGFSFRQNNDPGSSFGVTSVVVFRTADGKVHHIYLVSLMIIIENDSAHWKTLAMNKEEWDEYANDGRKSSPFLLI